jgi:hypothetical protein
MSFSMFDQSRVLMVEFDRDLAQIGLIINKAIRLQDGNVFNIGGPCERNVTTTINRLYPFCTTSPTSLPPDKSSQA